ncbi:hypothetical protein BU24DRAFT_409997 [Aaosphaeria arxii CBS 175.79]|uniref:Uncharacterized protein n=1 Tax=Aaosphaeria arxii CBS 175.79 TaxID=1450172 RepID=A0A6A5XN10_9PLEO|nr:uncharacterized protein BU24DRAFT_409997 [Aaosphaeria arxii CBS 175.79]KAF2014237.1 hypothetical protein BU24DRAFT_409997 [Aaosphaeria arxii CBS 175.79]
MADSRRETDSHEPNVVSEALAHVKTEPETEIPGTEQAEVYIKTEPLSDAGSDRASETQGWLDRPIFDGLRLLLSKEASDAEKTAAGRAVKKRVDNCNKMWSKAGKPACWCDGPHPAEMCLPGQEFEEYRHLRGVGDRLWKASQAAKRAAEPAEGAAEPRRGSPVPSTQGGTEVSDAGTARSSGKRSRCNHCGKWHAGGTNSCRSRAPSEGPRGANPRNVTEDFPRLENRARETSRLREGQSVLGARTEDVEFGARGLDALLGAMERAGPNNHRAQDGFLRIIEHLGGGGKRPAEDDEDDAPGSSKRSKRGGDPRRGRK